ncbi:hypothetical protein [Spirosoma lituiforme]
MTTDILFDPITGDILIENGELVVGDSTDQHTKDLIVIDKGWYKHDPRRGVGAVNFVNDDNNLPGLAAAIRLELIADGQDVDYVDIGLDGNVSVQTSYPS